MKVARTNNNNLLCRLQRHGSKFVNKIHRKTKRNVYLQAFASTTRQFCSNTSLHGIKYILGDDDDEPNSYTDSKRFVKINFNFFSWKRITFPCRYTLTTA